MSSVAFHTLDSDTVRIGGGERARAGRLVTDLFLGVLRIDRMAVGMKDSSYERMLSMLPSDHYARTASPRAEPAESLRLAIGSSGGALRWNGHEVDLFSLQLNTALALGSDAVKFSTRLHGQCEIHAFVRGENRAWLAEIVDRGVASGVLREPYQKQYGSWQDVSAMLRSSTASPVVTSYSVTESFPARAEQWELAFAKIDPRCELRPDDWETYRFRHELSALDVIAHDFKERFDRVFPPPVAEVP